MQASLAQSLDAVNFDACLSEWVIECVGFNVPLDT